MANANQFQPRNTRTKFSVLELFVYFAWFAVQSVGRRERHGRGMVAERPPQKDEAPSGAADWEDVAPDGA
jgi:hypothetical protein